MSPLEQLKSLVLAFDRPRISALEKYLDSPYFGIKKEISDFIKFCFQTDIPENGEDKELKKLWNQPSSSILKQSIEVIIHFIRQHEFDQLSTLKANANLAGIRKNNIEKLYKDTLSTIEKLPVTEFDQSSEFFYYRSLIEKNIFELKTENEKKNAKVKIASELNMHKISENVDIFYILEILKLAILSAIENPEEIKDIQQRSEVQFSLEAGKMYEADIAVVRLYRQLWQILINPNATSTEKEEWFAFFETIQHKLPEQEVEILKKGAALFALKS